MRFEPVIKHLIIVNVIFYLASTFQVEVSEFGALWYFQNPNYHWWQIFSHMFMHGGTMHLIFNMYALWAFGSPLSFEWGGNRFLVYYFACGLGAALLHLGVVHFQFQQGLNILQENGFSPNQVLETISQGKYLLVWKDILPPSTFETMMSAYQTRVVGASGAVYGILVAFAMMFPNVRLALLFFPVPIKAKYFVMILVGIDLFSGVTGFSIFGGNIAHFAHIGGAVIGFFLMILWNRKRFNQQRIY